MSRVLDEHWRVWLLVAMAVMIPVWAGLSAAGWSGSVRRVPSWFRLGAMWPAMLANWPAHQATLVMQGRGAGTNRMARPSAAGYVVHLVWSAVFWLPMVLAARRRYPRLLLMMGQVALFGVVMAGFFRWGNG